MTAPTYRNEPGANLTAAEVALQLRVKRNFVVSKAAEAGVRPMRGARKEFLFTAEDVETFREWMRSRPARGAVDPATVTTRRSAARRRKAA